MTKTPFLCLETTKTLIFLCRNISHGYPSDLSYAGKWEGTWNLFFFSANTSSASTFLYCPKMYHVSFNGFLNVLTNPRITQSVQSLSRVQLFVILWTAACQASLSSTNSRSLLKLMSIKSVMPSISSSVVPFSSCLQSFPALGSFSKESVLHLWWPKQ